MVRGGSAATYYVPQASAGQLQIALNAMSALDSNSCNESISNNHSSLLKANVVGVNDGDEIEINLSKKNNAKERIFIRAFAVNHRNYPALGYILMRKLWHSNYDGKRGKELLKDEYRQLNGNEIRKLVSKKIDMKIP